MFMVEGDPFKSLLWRPAFYSDARVISDWKIPRSVGNMYAIVALLSAATNA